MNVVKMAYDGKISETAVRFRSDVPPFVSSNMSASGLQEGEEYFIDLDSGEVLAQAHLLSFYQQRAQQIYDWLARRYPKEQAAEIISEIQSFHNFWGPILAEYAYSIMDRYEDAEAKKKALSMIQTYYSPVGGGKGNVQS